MASTLKEVAMDLGLSISTVSRVVNHKLYVNEETRQKVLVALEKHGYTPNQIARDLKNKFSKTIGIIIPDITENFFASVVKRASAWLQQEGYSILLCDSNEEVETENHYLKLLQEKRIAGLILASVSPTSDYVDKISRFNVQVVLIDSLFPEETRYDAVLIDNAKAGYMGCSHLLKKGKRNIGIITGPQDEYVAKKRLEGSYKAFREYDIFNFERLIRYGDFKEDLGYSLMLDLIETTPELDGVFIHSSKMTMGAIKALRENNIQYPQDISLVGFDLWDDYSLASPSLTSIVQPNEQIGERAAKTVIDRVNDTNHRLELEFLDPIILERQSG